MNREVISYLCVVLDGCGGVYWIALCSEGASLWEQLVSGVSVQHKTVLT